MAGRMPVLFVGHGNPMNAITDNRWSQAWRRIGQELPRPKAVLAVSAHWYVPGTWVTGNHDPPTIHDFGGFPDELHRYQYPAPGDPGLARRAADLVGPEAMIRSDWGLDHGTWSVLCHMFPKGDVPVVQLSVKSDAAPETMLSLGSALQPLRDEGVLVLGSGNLVHNLRSFFLGLRAGRNHLEPWASEFDERAASALQAQDLARLAHACDDEVGTMAHPSVDHYVPVLYTAGAGGDDPVSFPIEGFDGSISMRAVRWG